MCLSEVILSQSAQISSFSLVGKGTSVGDHTCVCNSIIGKGCKIGRNVSIQGSYIWDNVIIEDDCKISYALVCDGVHLSAGAVLEPGVILSFKVHFSILLNWFPGIRHLLIEQHQLIYLHDKVSKPSFSLSPNRGRPLVLYLLEKAFSLSMLAIMFMHLAHHFVRWKYLMDEQLSTQCHDCLIAC